VNEKSAKMGEMVSGRRR